MRTVHVICAFYRQYLLPTHIHYLENTGIEWIAACDDVDITPLKDNKKEWIKPILVPPLKIPGDQVYKKFNDCIDRIDIVDEDYYCFMGDDDSYEPGFFDVIRRQDSPIILTSASGGVGHPLVIHSFMDVRVGNINLQQYILKGSVLKQMRFNNNTPEDDGRFAEELVRRYPSQIKIISDSYTFMNYFQPGRYNGDRWKIKSTWENPKIIM